MASPGAPAAGLPGNPHQQHQRRAMRQHAQLLALPLVLERAQATRRARQPARAQAATHTARTAADHGDTAPAASATRTSQQQQQQQQQQHASSSSSSRGSSSRGSSWRPPRAQLDELPLHAHGDTKSAAAEGQGRPWRRPGSVAVVPRQRRRHAHLGEAGDSRARAALFCSS